MRGNVASGRAAERRSRWLRAVLLACAASFSGLAAGDAFALRCQGRLVTEGSIAIEVRRYCGEPASIQSHYAQRALIGRSGRLWFPGFTEEVRIEEWTYNFGPHRLMRMIRFENGVVARIEHLGYGFVE